MQRLFYIHMTYTCKNTHLITKKKHEETSLIIFMYKVMLILILKQLVMYSQNSLMHYPDLHTLTFW